jgi:ribose-phosphate pyrophosphokinase
MKIISYHKLNLTTESSSELEIKTFTFSGGEEYVKIDGFVGDTARIFANLRSSSDVMKLIMAVDAIRNINNQIKISLVMAYCPYARQDRICNKGESHSLKVFGNLINSLNFEKVYVVDPHSDVVGAVLNNVVIVKQRQVFDGLIKKDNKLFNFFSEALFVSPDAGANKKTFELAQYFGHKSFIRADKQRNLSDGKIQKVEIVTGENDIKDRDVVITDDCVDGGGTFILLAKELKKYSPKSISLYITHGIFSKGVDCLFESGIDKVFVTDSFNVIASDKVVTVGVADLNLDF